MQLRIPLARLVEWFPDLQAGALIAIRAAKLVLTQNSQRHPQPVTSEECPRVPVFRATHRRKDRSAAQRAAGKRCRDPLGDHQQQDEQYETRTYERPFKIVSRQRMDQQ